MTPTMLFSRRLPVPPSLLILFVLFCGSSQAAGLTDLGEGLAYLRVQAIEPAAAGLVAAIGEREALILDLRHVTVAADSAGQLRAALAGRKARPAVFVLVGPATPPAIADALAPVPDQFVTLGIKNAQPAPKIVVEQSPDADQRAYDALEAGQPLVSLISGKIDKERFDESTLMKEFRDGNLNAGPPPEPDPTVKKTGPEKAAAPAPKPVEILIDRVLQRAIHLHRALAAIKPR